MKKPETTDYLKEHIADAILLLLKEKPIEKITVEEIVKKANVGRATYFRAFTNKSEAITFKFIKMWEHYAELNDIKVRDRFDINNALDFFEYNFSIKHILTLVYAAGQQEAIHESFYRIMCDKRGDGDALGFFRESFYAQGLYGILDAWIRRDFKETPQEMADILRRLVITHNV